VGLPLLGLVGILKSGRGMIAPFSVDGAWKIESAVGHPLASPCGDYLSSVSNAPFSISQSGRTLVVTLGGTKTAIGTLEGKVIKAQFAGAGVAECRDRGLSLTATLDPLVEPRTFTGTLSVEGCGSCAPLEFRAVRQPKGAGGTR
jgi:hypothetical protein